MLPHVHPDKVLSEVEIFSANHGRQTHITMHKFVARFAWGPKLDAATEKDVYEAAKLAPCDIVASLERWKDLQRSSTLTHTHTQKHPGQVGVTLRRADRKSVV